MSEPKWSPSALEAMDAAIERLIRDLPEVNHDELALAVVQTAHGMESPTEEAVFRAVWRRYYAGALNK